MGVHQEGACDQRTGEAHALTDSYMSLQEAAKGQHVPLSCLKLAIDSTQLLLMWSLRTLEQSASPSNTAVTALSKAAASFGNQLDAIGAVEDDADVQQRIQKTQSNLFLVFSPRKLKVCLPYVLQPVRSRIQPCKPSVLVTYMPVLWHDPPVPQT